MRVSLPRQLQYTSPISRSIPCILEKLAFTGIHQSSIMLPRDHFNDVIAQWEVNRNIFMVHLPRRILDLPAIRFQSRAIKIATKKRLPTLKEPLEAMARKDGAEGCTYIERDRDTRKVGCLLNLPLKGTELILREISVLYVTFQ